MRIKTIVSSLIAILLITVILQNTGQVKFSFLFMDFYLSKLIMMLLIAMVAFGLGYLVGRPKKIRKLSGDFTDGSSKPNTLTEEDKNYIN